MPGLPGSYDLCDINYNNESYRFENKSLSLTIWITKLSSRWPYDKQLDCINEESLKTEKKLLKIVNEKYDIETNIKPINPYLKPVFKIIRHTQDGQVIDYSLSALLQNHIAINFVFTGLNNAESLKLIDSILASINFTDTPKTDI